MQSSLDPAGICTETLASTGVTDMGDGALEFRPHLGGRAHTRGEQLVIHDGSWMISGHTTPSGGEAQMG